jgi:hypothetical protein
MAENPTGEHLVAPAGEDMSRMCTSRQIPLLVKECVPGSGFLTLTRVGRLRTAYVTRPEEALALPWIERLPGEKRIKVVHGQIFVMQLYLGFKVVRAHIWHEEEMMTVA